MKRWSFTKVVGLRNLIMVAIAVLIVAIAIGPLQIAESSTPSWRGLPLPSPTVSPTPTPEVKRPNPVRRFFSSISHRITGVFRRPNPPACSLPPLVYLTSSSSSIAVCPVAQYSDNPSCSSDGEVTLNAGAEDPDKNELLYTWSVTAGRLSGDGRKVTWNLAGVAEGTYTALVEVNDGNQLTSSASTTVKVAHCTDCVTWESPCPTVAVSCPSTVESKQPMTFVATVSGGDPAITPTYQWSLSAGKMISGQGTSKVVVDVSNLTGQSVTATVSVGGFHPLCKELNVASCSAQIGP